MAQVSELTITLDGRQAKLSADSTRRSIQNLGKSSAALAGTSATASGALRRQAGATRVLGTVNKTTLASTRALSTGIKSLVLAGAGFAGFAGISTALSGGTKAALEFDAALAELLTILPEGFGNVDKFVLSLRELAKEFGTTGLEQIRAAYQGVSASIGNTTDLTLVLNAANLLARAGLTSVAEGINILTTAINTGAGSYEDSEKLASLFFGVVRNGKIDLTELAAGFGIIASPANLAGIAISEVGAVIAVATQNGVPAAQAFTRLAALINALAAPTKEVSRLHKELGVDFSDVSFESGEWLLELEKLRVATDGNSTALRTAIGPLEAYNFAQVLTGKNLQAGLEFIKAYESGLFDVSTAAGKISEALSGRLKTALAGISDQLQSLGDEILPGLVKAVEYLNDNFEKVIRIAKRVAIFVLAIFGAKILVGITRYILKIGATITQLAALTATTTAATGAQTALNTAQAAGGITGVASGTAVVESLGRQTKAVGFLRNAFRALSLVVRVIPVLALATAFITVIAAGVGLKRVSDTLKDNTRDLKDFQDTLDGTASNFTVFKQLGLVAFDAIADAIKGIITLTTQLFDEFGGFLSTAFGFVAGPFIRIFNAGKELVDAAVAGSREIVANSSLGQENSALLRARSNAAPSSSIDLRRPGPAAVPLTEEEVNKLAANLLKEQAAANALAKETAAIEANNLQVRLRVAQTKALEVQAIKDRLQPERAARDAIVAETQAIRDSLPPGRERTELLRSLGTEYSNLLPKVEELEMKLEDPGPFETYRNGIDSLADAFENFAIQGVKSASDALADFVLTGKLSLDSFGDVLKNIAQQILSLSIQRSIVAPLASFAGGLLPFQNGGAFDNGRTLAFASGGVINSPTFFQTNGRNAVAGEAGPEAILPLSRGRGGKLGVQSTGGGGGGNTYVSNINIEGGVDSPQRVEEIGRVVDAVITKRIQDENINNLREGGYGR